MPQGRAAQRREGDSKARLAKILGEHLGEAGIVFDNQNALGHMRRL
jgi:hypothetical protein